MQHYHNPDEDRDTRFPAGTFAVCLALGALFWGLLLNKCTAQPYRITTAKIATWTGSAIGGAVWGAREAYHADLQVFEKKWGVDEYSFFGSKAWERNYISGRYYEGNTLKKPEFMNVTRDFWHFSGATSRVFLVGTTFTIGASKQKFTHKLADLGISLGIGALSGFAAYKYLR